jgi:NAD(P)-dependent dehydrogenase (short-subunit alcohol dehydrogenase family)
MTDRKGTTDQPLALVAGGSRGLGLALAHELGRTGYRVVITARTAADLDRAATQLTADGITALTRVHDVRDAAGARDLVSTIESEHGPIEVMIMVAGIIRVGASPHDAEEFDESIDIMLRGPIAMVQAVLPGMKERRRGRIGVVSSIAGIVPTPHLVPYTAAKFGAVGYTRSLSTELSGSPVTVSLITPGLMRTGGHWNAEYVGQPAQEYRWFTLLSAIPVVSADARRAARIIVRGVLAGRHKIIFTPLARVGEIAERISPTAVDRVTGLLGRLLPPPGDDHQPGRLASRSTSQLFRRMTTPAREAVRRFNQVTAHGNDTEATP